jgi:hypothetical protein
VALIVDWLFASMVKDVHIPVPEVHSQFGRVLPHSGLLSPIGLPLVRRVLFPEFVILVDLGLSGYFVVLLASKKCWLRKLNGSCRPMSLQWRPSMLTLLGNVGDIAGTS